MFLHLLIHGAWHALTPCSTAPTLCWTRAQS